jgi:hypothetical protein
LFDEGNIGLLLLLAVLDGALIWVGWRRRGWDRNWSIPLLVTLSAVPQAYIVWLSGGEATHEIDRLSMVAAVSLRIGLFTLTALALDRVVALQRERRASHALASAGPVTTFR